GMGAAKWGGGNEAVPLAVRVENELADRAQSDGVAGALSGVTPGSGARRKKAEPQRAQNDHSQGQARAQNDQHGTVKKSCPRLDRGLDLASFLVAHDVLLARLRYRNVNAGQWRRFLRIAASQRSGGKAGRHCV